MKKMDIPIKIQKTFKKWTKILKLKITITEIKDSIEGFTGKCEQAEESLTTK